MQSEVSSQSNLYVTANTNPIIADDMAASINPIVCSNPVMLSKDNTPNPIKG